MSSLDLNNSFGALLLGTIISSMLYGAMCLQSWYYFQNYSDGPLMKSAVAALLYFSISNPSVPHLMPANRVLESLHSAFSIHAIYYYLVLNYLNPTALLRATWSAAAVLLVTHLIRIIVEMFYVWRVYIVSERNAPLAIFIAVLELACLGTGVATAILVLQIQLFSDFLILPKVIVNADTSLGLSAAVDILIAGSLSFYLHLRKTGISGTDKIIDRLVVHVVNNGIATSIASVLCLIFATADKTSLIYLMIYQCIAHLYSNTMLSTLNTRRRQSTSRVLPTSVELSGIYVSDSRATLSSSISSRGTTVKSI